MELLEK